ncbi:hypothetical protein Bca4012_093989 [Brassica carinata]
MGDIWTWLISFFFLIALVGIIVYQDTGSCHSYVFLISITTSNCVSIDFSYSKRQHLVDVTEIFNLLNREKKKRLFKLAYIILNLFLTIFCLSNVLESSSDVIQLFYSDIPMGQLIVNMNNSMPSSQRFIIHVLDSTHLFVLPHVEQMIRSAIAEFRNQNSYEKPT